MTAKKLMLMCALLLFAVPGCADPDENALATEGATADDLAQYEADLAAVTADEDHEDVDENQ